MTILQLLITNNYPDGNCFEYNIWFVINIIIDVFATFSHFNSYYHFVFLNNVHDLHTQRHPGPAPWDQWLGQVQLIPSPSLLICFFFRFYAHYPSPLIIFAYVCVLKTHGCLLIHWRPHKHWSATSEKRKKSKPARSPFCLKPARQTKGQLAGGVESPRRSRRPKAEKSIGFRGNVCGKETH